MGSNNAYRDARLHLLEARLDAYNETRKALVSQGLSPAEASEQAFEEARKVESS